MVYLQYRCPECGKVLISQVPERSTAAPDEWLYIAAHCIRYDHANCPTSYVDIIPQGGEQ